uniref:Cilia- and flagella-associated protein 36 n=1 Tax=Elaeophora elaphi TaxID=1147741 RepID=A0A0R3S0A2_9BILA
MFKRHSQCELSSEAIFDKFINFLSSSMWNIPIATFLEQYSVGMDVFDDEQNDLLLYQKIHDEFKSMVHVLMEGFCGDLNIEANQLLSALKHHDNSHKLSTEERSLLGPVVAAQNFNVFVPMMIRENIELQLQTIEMIEFLCGVIPAALCLEYSDMSEEEFRKVLMEGLNREQYNRYVCRKSEVEFQDEIEKCKKIQLREAMNVGLQEKERLEECKQKREYEISTALEQKIDDKEVFSNAMTSPNVEKQLSFKGSKKLSEVKDTEIQFLNKKEALPEEGRKMKKQTRKMPSNSHNS